MVIAFAPDLRKTSFYSVVGLFYYSSTNGPSLILIQIKGSGPNFRTLQRW